MTRQGLYVSLTQANFTKIFNGPSTRQQKLKADMIATMLRANCVKQAIDYAIQKKIDAETVGKITACIEIPEPVGMREKIEEKAK